MRFAWYYSDMSLSFTVEANGYKEACEKILQDLEDRNMRFLFYCGNVASLSDLAWTPEQEFHMLERNGNGCPGCGFEKGKANCDGYSHYGHPNPKSENGVKCPFCGRFFHECYLDEVSGTILWR